MSARVFCTVFKCIVVGVVVVLESNRQAEKIKDEK